MTDGGAAPIIFVFPGLRGDEPGLATFRRELATVATPVLLDHPDIGHPARLLSDIRLTGRLSADIVASRQPAGPIRLVGASFGTCVAYEAAVALRASGRTVAGLALFDPPFGGVTPSGYGRSPRWRRAGVALLRWLTRRDAFRTWTMRLASACGGDQRWSRFLIGFLRRQAIAGWHPGPLPEVPGLVVASAEFGATTRIQAARVLPLADVVIVPGTHAEMKATVSPRLLKSLALV